MRTGFADIVCSSSSSENDAAYDVSIYLNFLWMACLLKVSTFFFSSQIDFLFYYFRLLTLQIVSYIQVYSIILALCTLGYAVRIFHTTDTKYVIFVLVDTNL